MGFSSSLERYFIVMLYSAVAVFCHSIFCDLDHAQDVTIAARLNVVSEAGSAYWMLTPSGYQPLASYTAQSFLSSSFCFRVRVETTPH